MLDKHDFALVFWKTVSYYREYRGVTLGFETQDVERKTIAILRILGQSSEPVGARVISRNLKEQGIELSERAVRYHLKLMDERGFTESMGRDGRLITQLGLEESESALVSDKVGFVASKIELLAYQTEFDLEKRRGEIPVNISFFPERQFKKAIEAMKSVFQAGICVSELVAVARQGEKLGEIIVPQGKIGLATVCSVIVNGALLKAGVPMDSKFGGILQIKTRKPLRFVELIQYSGSSLDPSEIYITSKMTSVGQVVRKGEGRILANFREIPALCQPEAEKVVAGLKEAHLGGVLMMGEVSKSVCEVNVELNKVGMILTGGLNPVAAAVESGVEVETHAMSAIMQYKELVVFREL
ncbi:MAG: NrpR regulatory domain-containing protein [Dehalococcoidia bacterium]|nr:NrpR regulatory domain-containing protein [Dehalococcoidia bacterium]